MQQVDTIIHQQRQPRARIIKDGTELEIFWVSCPVLTHFKKQQVDTVTISRAARAAATHPRNPRKLPPRLPRSKHEDTATRALLAAGVFVAVVAGAWGGVLSISLFKFFSNL